MKKERIMITHMETVGAFTRIFAYTMADGLGFVIAKGSVMHV